MGMVTLENIKTDPLTFQSHLLVFPLGAAMGSGIINPFLALLLTVFPRLIGHVLQGQVNTNTVKKHLKTCTVILEWLPSSWVSGAVGPCHSSFSPWLGSVLPCSSLVSCGQSCRDMMFHN